MNQPTTASSDVARDISDDFETEPKRRVNEWWTRRRDRKQTESAGAGRPKRTGWDLVAVVALAIGVLVIVGVGLRVGLGALRDAAVAAHIDGEASRLYWIGVDGLIVVAIIAALVLRNVPAARRYCMGVVAAFTAASGLLQYLHGLGWFTPDRVTGVISPLPWGVVLVIALLVIGTIFCGTHLFQHVLRHLFPGSPLEQAKQPSTVNDGPGPKGGEDEGPDHPQDGGQLAAETEREVRKWFAAVAVNMLLEAGAKPVRARVAREFGIADRQAGYVIADVLRERELAAERAEQERAAKAAHALTGKPSPNGSGPLPEPSSSTSL